MKANSACWGGEYMLIEDNSSTFNKALNVEGAVYGTHKSFCQRTHVER